MPSTHRGTCTPCLQLTVAPFGQVVHVLEQFRPSHHAGCSIWLHKVWASALGVCTNFLAHLFTLSRKLVLNCDADLHIFSNASLLALSALHLDAHKRRGALRPCLQLTVAPL